MAFGYNPGFNGFQAPQAGFSTAPTYLPPMQQNPVQAPTAATRQGFMCIPVTCREQVVATQIPLLKWPVPSWMTRTPVYMTS